MTAKRTASFCLGSVLCEEGAKSGKERYKYQKLLILLEKLYLFKLVLNKIVGGVRIFRL